MNDGKGNGKGKGKDIVPVKVLKPLVMSKITEIPKVFKSGNREIYEQILNKAIEDGGVKVDGKKGMVSQLKKFCDPDFKGTKFQITARENDLMVMVEKVEGEGN